MIPSPGVRGRAWNRGDAAAARTPREWLLHFAAEAHRRKWALQDNPAAFEALHRLGDEMIAALNDPEAT